MTHIHGMQDADLHNDKGQHIRPRYKSPREQMPDDPATACVTGPVVSGADVARAQKEFASATARFEKHLNMHMDQVNSNEES